MLAQWQSDRKHTRCYLLIWPDCKDQPEQAHFTIDYGFHFGRINFANMSNLDHKGNIELPNSFESLVEISLQSYKDELVAAIKQSQSTS